MANTPRRNYARVEDDVQYLEVHGLPSQPIEIRPNENGGRLWDQDANLFHYSHVKMERPADEKRCKICIQGLAGVFTTLEAPIPEPEPEVVSSAGAYEKYTSALALADEQYRAALADMP